MARTRHHDKLMHAAGSDAGPASHLDMADQLLTAADVARRLTISVASVRRLQRQRQIPFVKIKGSIRYLVRDIAAYVTEGRVERIGR